MIVQSSSPLHYIVLTIKKTPINDYILHKDQQDFPFAKMNIYLFIHVCNITDDKDIIDTCLPVILWKVLHKAQVQKSHNSNKFQLNQRKPLAQKEKQSNVVKEV